MFGVSGPNAKEFLFYSGLQPMNRGRQPISRANMEERKDAGTLAMGISTPLQPA
jgi:hypothetical protein